MASITTSNAVVGDRDSTGKMKLSFTYTGYSNDYKVRVKVNGSVQKTLASGYNTKCEGTYSTSVTDWGAGSRSFSVTVEGADTGSESWSWQAGTTRTLTWDAAQFTVTFNPGQGTTPTVSQPATYGEAYGELPTPVRSGYEFLGWFTSADGGTQVTAEDTVSITTNQILYAHWNPMSILHYVETKDGTTTERTITNIQVVETVGGTKYVRKVIGCYAVETVGGTKYVRQGLK